MPFDNVSFILEKHWINFAPESFYLLFCSFFFIIIILYDIIYYVATKLTYVYQSSVISALVRHQPPFSITMARVSRSVI